MYQNVIDDVIKNVREEFLNEAVDLEILEDLKRVRYRRAPFFSRAINFADFPVLVKFIFVVLETCVGVAVGYLLHLPTTKLVFAKCVFVPIFKIYVSHKKCAL